MNKEVKNNTFAAADVDEAALPEHTQEQATAVHRILQLSEKKACLYEILDVPKDATEADIQKAVRELARKVHPDKNPAPGATEAMTAVNYAAAVLLVPEKRLEYDRRREQNGQHYFTPEETFHLLFSQESLTTLRVVMPWLAAGVGAFFAGAGAYKLLASRRKEPEPSSAEQGGQRKSTRK